MMKYFFTRRDFLKVINLGTMGFFISCQKQTNVKELIVYVGTYTSGDSEGIYICKLDLSSGKLTIIETVKGLVNPNFLAIDPQFNYLYSIDEVRDSDGNRRGAISAFSINQKTGGLTFLNKQPAKGPAPCHLTVDNTGRFVLTANYSNGNVSVFPVLSDGSLGAFTDFVQHQGSSLDPNRQTAPHAHSINVDASNRYAFVPDLGIDKIMIYKLDTENGKLNPNDEPWVKLKPGAGPRHFTFHPNGKYAYVINEIDCTITAFSYDETQGVLKEVQTVPTLPEDFSDKNTTADIHISPSGKHLYGSNRGHNSIVIFSIDKQTGKLTYVGHEPTQGESPRNFAVDPTGTFLLAENQRSNNIVTFRIDSQTGKLSSTGSVIEIPSPVCIKMIPFSF